mmetsp:Transcript_35713/g.63132  ORF Transcript_35713/g.63132 Transcript_35713/m.63132 type:complete len:85 (+) Transcript_35713:365-619(+)
MCALHGLQSGKGRGIPAIFWRSLPAYHELAIESLSDGVLANERRCQMHLAELSLNAVQAPTSHSAQLRRDSPTRKDSLLRRQEL